MAESKPKEYNETEQSEFNAGIATLQRLHETKKWMMYATTQNDPRLLFEHLKAFWKELHPLLSDSKTKTHKSEKEKQKENYLECLKEINKPSAEYNKIRLMICLEGWELELRELEQAHKLNMPMGKDSRWAMSSKHR